LARLPPLASAFERGDRGGVCERHEFRDGVGIVTVIERAGGRAASGLDRRLWAFCANG